MKKLQAREAPIPRRFRHVWCIPAFEQRRSHHPHSDVWGNGSSYLSFDTSQPGDIRSSKVYTASVWYHETKVLRLELQLLSNRRSALSIQWLVILCSSASQPRRQGSRCRSFSRSRIHFQKHLPSQPPSSFHPWAGSANRGTGYYHKVCPVLYRVPRLPKARLRPQS